MKRRRLIFTIAVVLTVFVIGGVLFIRQSDNTIVSETYEELTKKGYSGTPEEWIASLAGETVTTDFETESAFLLARKKGYTGSIEEWTQAIIGKTAESNEKTMYELACENGFSGTLQEWLSSLMKNSELLGKSKDKTQKTEYEYACEYGFQGNYIEWIVSLVNK